MMRVFEMFFLIGLMSHVASTITFPDECPVTYKPTQDYCIKKRLADTTEAREWFKITNKDSPTSSEFPLAKLIPWLDQPTSVIKYHYTFDRFESRTIMLLDIWNKTLSGIMPAVAAKFANAKFETNKDFADFRLTMQAAIKSQGVPYFSNPTQDADYATDHFTSGFWKSDEAFVQRRLAGQCPFLMKKVITSGRNGILYKDLYPLINARKLKNMKFDYSDKEWISMDAAIECGRLFILHHPDISNLKKVADPYAEILTDRKVSDIKSPISFFILGEDGHFKLVAIQRNPGKKVEVLTPRNSKPETWLLAKGEMDMATDMYCQSKLHTGGVHFTSTIYCLAYQRHLSTRHPLFEFFKYHCEGTVAQISIALGTLGNTLEKLYAIGRDQYFGLAVKAYNERNYEHASYDYFVKENGLDDERIKYYPFREDAKEILSLFKAFVHKFVQTYYGAHNSNSIRDDKELQAMANEISIHGTKKPDGGKGKMVHFPPYFRKNHQLKTFLYRFLWNNVFHTTSNYSPDQLYLPTGPGKIYEKKDGEEMPYLKSLSGQLSNVEDSAFGNLVGNLRINRIFDYWNQVTDPKFRAIARRAYQKMHKQIQPMLEKRNARRKAKNQLGMQILEPKWLTNSIHI